MIRENEDHLSETLKLVATNQVAISEVLVSLFAAVKDLPSQPMSKEQFDNIKANILKMLENNSDILLRLSSVADG